MKGKPELIKRLTVLLADELSARDQYSAQQQRLELWGYNKLAEAIKGKYEDESEHAQELANRIYFLEGKPPMKPNDVMEIGDTVPEMLESNAKRELGAIEAYNEAIAMAVGDSDEGTAELLRHIMLEEEGHRKFFETQLDQLEQMGLQNYLSIQV